MSALKYDITPIVDGEVSEWTLTLDPLTGQEVASTIARRLQAMEKQGYRKETACMTVPLSSVQYIIKVADHEEDRAPLG